MMNSVQKQAAEALREFAVREHEFLAEAAKVDGFEVSAIDTASDTDSVYEAWFSLKLQGKKVYLTFSLGYDVDNSCYSPAIEVAGGSLDNPTEFANRFVGAAQASESGLLDAVVMLSQVSGEARANACQWLQGTTGATLTDTARTTYIILVDGREFGTDTDEALALARAKTCFEERSLAMPATVCVVTDGDKLLSWRSNRRILGSFTKQVWGGRKKDNAVDVSTEEFDATDAVLRMPLKEIVDLEDCSDNTDSLGNQLVQWDGPCSVHVTESLLAFFGVLDADDLTEEHLTLAREVLQPSPAVEGVVVLTISVRVRKAQGRSWEEVANELNYTVSSGTPGAVVTQTEVTEQVIKVPGLSRYEVEVGYGELGSGENNYLGTWAGLARDEEHAEDLAYDEIWDRRLDKASCAPRYKVSLQVDEG